MIAEIDLLLFFVQPSVFSKHVKVDDLQLPPEGVCVVWKWDMTARMKNWIRVTRFGKPSVRDERTISAMRVYSILGQKISNFSFCYILVQ